MPSASGQATEAQAVLRSARRVLVVRTDDLGDNVLGSSFPTLLAAALPGECGFVGPPAAIELIPTAHLEFVQAVDCRPNGYLDVVRAGQSLGAAIRKFHPDVVVLPRFDFEREALGIASALALPRRTITWAKDATTKRRRRSWWLSALPGPRLPASGAPLHEWDRLKAFGEFLGLDATQLKPSLAPDVLNSPVPVPKLDATSLTVALGIGAAQGKRLWPPERFAALAQQLERSGFLPVLLGSDAEVERASAVLAAMPRGATVVDLVGKLTLRSTAALLSRVQLFVGNDSGLGHIAAAAGSPTVTISCHPLGAPATHINSPERYHPVSNRSAVVRPLRAATPGCTGGCTSRDTPCCVATIPVEAVIDACLTLEAAGGGGQ